MKTLTPLEAAQFLMDTGLLFEINRTLLQPLGFALVFTADETTPNVASEPLKMWTTDDKAGFVFNEEAWEEGLAKYQMTMTTPDILERKEFRLKELGFIVQDKLILNPEE